VVTTFRLDKDMHGASRTAQAFRSGLRLCHQARDGIPKDDKAFGRAANLDDPHSTIASDDEGGWESINS